ncbi:iron-sulfur cluster assembly protein [Coprothermobacter platensis]|uniref:iron-sulfur cluster assembly protein n=1 Tax=Coprothermobacter platensis TaxID=108819 RepID=UPI00039B1FE1
MDFRPVYLQDAKTEEERTILESLQQVIDPEIGFDVVNLGLIYGLGITEDTINVKMTMTFAGCPLMDYMVAQVKDILTSLALRPHVNVELVFDPSWTPEFINPAIMNPGAAQ